MDNVTDIQKSMMKDLAREFYGRLDSILERSGPREIELCTESDCALMRSFAEMIVEAVSGKYPENDDKNDDAVLAVMIADRLISRYAKGPA